MTAATTILIVDDDEINLDVLEASLTPRGFDVMRARDGREALEAARSRRPRLVVTDILMPNMDGYQLCRELKRDPELRRIPVIFYTATYTDAEDQAFALSLGAARFVIKPAEPERFQAVIAEVLAQHTVAPAEGGAAPELDEHTYLSRYNQRLVSKLEDKIEQLDRSRRRLEEEICRARDAEERVRHLAHYDPVTGLPNRTRFLQDAAVAFAEGRAARSRCAVLVVDIDAFHAVNHTLGFAHGNQLLRLFGERLATAPPLAGTSPARVGEDEFAVVLGDIADGRTATRVADHLLRHLSGSFDLDGLLVELTASVGIAVFPEDGAEPGLLLRHSEVAMRGVRGSRGAVAVYRADADPYEPARLQLMSDLRRAVEGSELVLHFQPKIDLGRDRVVGVEALVRWQHPELGLLLPDNFVPLAEQTGQIRSLTSWVLRNALAECARTEGCNQSLGLAVNLSARDLLDDTLPEELATLLAAETGHPVHLTVEITESALLHEPLRARAVLDRLAGLGVSIAIDDFGTGYSSLSHLKVLPVRELKIDKSFVLSMSDNGSDAAIVRSTIDLAHNLGLEATAEGVEQPEVLAQLKELGCDLAQGFFLGTPMPAAELRAWLTRSPWT